MRKNKLVAISFTILLLFGCNKNKVENKENILATVFNQTVTAEELDAELNVYLASLPGDYNLTEEELSKIKPEILDSIIDKKMYTREMDKLQIPVDEKAVQTRYNQLLMEFGSEDNMRTYISNFGFTLEGLFQEFAYQTRLNNLGLYAEELDYSITEEEAEKFYNENKETVFVVKGSVSASHILIPLEEKQENTLTQITKIRNEIVSGLAFEEAAAKYSTCPSKEDGGNLGEFKKGQMVPEFENVAFSQEIGKISEPVLTQFGYHLIRVDSKIEDRISDYSEARDFIIKHLKKDAYFKELRERANIVKTNLEG
jgi:peptidyl-prolyl cis-trans isomerase C